MKIFININAKRDYALYKAGVNMDIDGDRPVLEDEIEVTPEMIKAGEEVLRPYLFTDDPLRFFEYRQALSEVFLAMSKVAKDYSV